jgi:hypothetical protein
MIFIWLLLTRIRTSSSKPPNQVPSNTGPLEEQITHVTKVVKKKPHAIEPLVERIWELQNAQISHSFESFVKDLEHNNIDFVGNPYISANFIVNH